MTTPTPTPSNCNCERLTRLEGKLEVLYAKFDDRDDQIKEALDGMRAIRTSMDEVKGLLVGVMGAHGLVERVQALEDGKLKWDRQWLYITGFAAGLYYLLKEKLKTIGF